ncbi:MAG: hypothetical protein P8N23_05735 [Methylophilaceae bacterium]|jgi:hypothetical protein|nr:hypothetical protein [Methylophilaceae bacterium]MDG1452855.1 hypothetical protein [Methylophilaceae bacterium]
MQILLVSAFVAGVWLLQQKSNLLSLFFVINQMAQRAIDQTMMAH